MFKIYQISVRMGKSDFCQLNCKTITFESIIVDEIVISTRTISI